MQKCTRGVFSFLSVLALVGAIGCGNDSNDNGNNGGTVNGGVPPSGAVTALTHGAITAVEDNPARIVVNGAEVPTANATIRVDDNPNPATLANLLPGQVVTVKRHENGGFEIEVEDSVKGTADDTLCTGTGAAACFTIGGVPVRFDDTTHFEDNAFRTAAGRGTTKLKVHGFPDDNGGLRASRVSRADDPGDDQFQFEVKGIVEALVDADTFTIKVSPSATSTFTVNLASGGTMPAVGDIVEVRGTKVPGEATINNATTTPEDRLANGLKVEVEGIVSSGNSASFVVNGVTVVPVSTAKFEGGTPADVVPGARLEAEGVMNGTTLSASKVSFRANVRLVGPVSNADSAAGTFSIFGKTIHVDAQTRVEDGFPADNALVELRGSKAIAGSTFDIAATRVRASNDNRLTLQGPIDSEDPAAGTVVILGIPVAKPTDGYRNEVNDDSSNDTPMDQALFFSTIAPGSVVKARTANDNLVFASPFPAKELEIEELHTTVILQ